MSERRQSAPKETAPLRRIVASFTNKHGTQVERLECGHIVHQKQDFHGHANAVQRRCWKCKRGALLNMEAQRG